MGDPIPFCIRLRGMKTLYQILTAMSTYNFMDVPSPPSPLLTLHIYLLYTHNNPHKQRVKRQL
jgi:hypothetical protein